MTHEPREESLDGVGVNGGVTLCTFGGLKVYSMATVKKLLESYERTGSYRRTAREMGIAHNTVRKYVLRAHKKIFRFGLNSYGELIYLFTRILSKHRE